MGALYVAAVQLNSTSVIIYDHPVILICNCTAFGQFEN